jgi:uncharacterized protein (DUF1501 family)
MSVTRRDFIRGGVTAFTVGFAAPGFLCDIARAQGAARRNLVVVYLGGGNDALSTLVPYTDTFYYSRRPTQAVPAGEVLQIGSDRNGKALGLHPRLIGLRTIFNDGRLALIQRAGYENSSRSHFYGIDIWATASPNVPTGPGWLGKYLDTLPAPIDPLAGWAATQEVPHAMQARIAGVPAIPSVTNYAFASPNGGDDAQLARKTATKISSHVPVDRPHLAFVNSTAQAAFATLDRVAAVASYQPTTTYPNTGVGQALRAVAGALVKGTGTRIFWVQTGGYDTHAGQGTNGQNGAYGNLMGTLNDGLLAFYTDVKNQGLLSDTLVLQWSEFGRRIAENGSQGTDHGAGGLMMALGGAVRGGLYGAAASLNPAPDNQTLENSGNDVRYETDFRAVYARVLDNWLGVDSTAILGGNYRNAAVNFI